MMLLAVMLKVLLLRVVLDLIELLLVMLLLQEMGSGGATFSGVALDLSACM